MNIDEVSNQVLVKWDLTCIWWSLLFDNMISIIYKDSLDENDQNNLFMYITLLGRLISYQKVLSVYFIETKYNELCLYSLLQNLNFLDIYPSLSDNGENIESIKKDYEKAKKRLLNLKLDINTIELIVSKIENKSCNDSFFHFPISVFIGKLVKRSFDVLTRLVILYYNIS